MTDQIPFRQSVAVVIGIDAYTDGVPTLQTPTADARRLRRILADDHGYNVQLLLDEEATGAAILGLLDQLSRTLGPDDRVLFYFAGHGVALQSDDGPAGYLVPQDARAREPETFLQMSELNDALSAIDCRHLLVILDSCFSGAFRWSSTRDLIVPPEVIHQERYDRFIMDPAWQALASASHDQLANDVLPNTFGDRGNVDGHSPFAQALFDALEGDADLAPAGGTGDGVITASELGVYLEAHVQPVTIDGGIRQTPRLWPLAKHDKGEFIFLVPGHDLNLPPAPPLTDESNPWRGLKSYEEIHEEMFFGRDGVIEDLKQIVEDHALTVVLGASGTGKSSVVKAGLVPTLKPDASPPWHVLSPIRPGTDPMHAVERAVAELGESGGVEERVAAWCTANPKARLVLVVDQLEELVTMTGSASERDAVLNLLGRLLDTHPEQVRVVLTLRSDFEPQFDRSALGARWPEARYVVPPMTQDEIRAVIEQPASKSVMYFKPSDLVDTLINEVIQAPGGLPLLSFALSEMYVHYIGRRSDDRAIETDDYEKVGGVIGALRTRADVEFNSFGAAHRETMRRLMLRMVAIEGGHVARRRVPSSEMEYPDPEETARANDVVQQLTGARLVVGDGDESYVEPAHDALVNGWDRLLRWIHTEQERDADLRFQHRLTRAAQEWAGADSDRTRTGILWRDSAQAGRLLQQVVHEERSLRPSALPRRRRLARAGREAWRRLWPDRTGKADEGVWMTQTELDFARASVRRRGQIRIGLSVLVVSIVLGILATSWFAYDANKQLDIANSRLYANLAREALEQDPLRALVFAIEAAVTHTFLAEDVLRRSLREPRVVAVLHGHGGPVESAAFSHDGQRVVTASADSTARVWDAGTGDELAVLRGHTGAVNAAAFSRDGQRVVTVSRDGPARVRARVWDAGTGDELAVLRGHTGAVNAAAFSRDGQRVVTVSRGDTAQVRVWDAETGDELAVLRGHSEVGFPEAFSPDGQRVVTASLDGTARVWDAETGDELAVLRGHTGAGLGAAFSHDGQRVVTAGLDGTARVWDAETGDELAVLRGHSEVVLDAQAISGAAISPDGQRVVTASSGGTARVWDVETGTELAVLRGHWEEVREDAFSPDGQRIVTASLDGTARVWDAVWDAETGDELAVLRGHSEEVLDAAFSPDGQRVVTASADGTARVWDAKFEDGSFTLGYDEFLSSAAISHDGQRIVTVSSGGTARVWDAETDDDFSVHRHSRVWGAAISQDGQRVVTAGWDGTARVWDAETGDELAVLRGHSEAVLGAAFSLDGQRVVTASWDSTARVWDAETGDEISALRHARRVRGIRFKAAISPDGQRVVTVIRGDTAQVWVWDAETGDELAVLRGHSEAVNAAAFSSDGQRVVTASADGAARVWDAGTGDELAVLHGHSEAVLGAAFSLDGQRVVTVSRDGTARVWDAETGDELAALRHNRVWGAAFSLDGQRVVTAGRDVTARVWDAETGDELAVLRGHSEAVNAAAFSSDGQRVVTVSSDGMVRVFLLHLQDLIDLAESRLPVTMTEERRQRIIDQ